MWSQSPTALKAPTDGGEVAADRDTECGRRGEKVIGSTGVPEVTGSRMWSQSPKNAAQWPPPGFAASSWKLKRLTSKPEHLKNNKKKCCYYLTDDRNNTRGMILTKIEFAQICYFW
jgi:hypothetical protein